MKLHSTASVLAARDVQVTSSWYADHFGFKASFFPDAPPHDFAILCRDDVEIMLRRCEPAARSENDWDVYIRMAGVDALHEAVRARVPIVEPLRTKVYQCREFAVEDPDGHRVVFSESVD